MAKIYYALMLVGGLGGAVLLCLGLLLLWGQNYETFTTILLDYVDKQDWRAYFEQSVFPSATFQLARYLLLLLTILYGILIFWSTRFLPKMANALAQNTQYFNQQLLKGFQDLNPWQRISLILLASIFLVRSLWCIHYYAVDYDEAWTYNHFSSKGPLICMISPNNNHIFYSILASLMDLLPIPAKWAIRLPALLAGSLAFMLYFVAIRKLLGVGAALGSLGYFAFSSGMTFYSVLGRGYGWQLVFGIVLTVACLQLLKSKAVAKRWQWVYVIAFVLGVYSNPSFLYLGVGLAFFYLGRLLLRAERIWGAVQLHLWVGLFLLVLHLPLLLTNGGQILLDAVGNSAASSSDVLFHTLNRTVDWLFWGRGTLPFWSYLLVLALLLFWHRKTKVKSIQELIFYLALMQLCLPFVYILMSWTNPPYRIWAYLVLFVGMMLAVCLKSVDKLPPLYQTLILVAISTLSLYSSTTHYFLNWSADLDREAQKIANLLLEKEVESCYSFTRYDKPLLEFYFLEADRPFQCWMPFKASKDFQPFHQQHYDAILVDVEDYSPSPEVWSILEKEGYQLVYENYRVKLYLYPNE